MRDSLERERDLILLRHLEGAARAIRERWDIPEPRERRHLRADVDVSGHSVLLSKVDLGK